jgi:hypothetical protein
LPFTDPGRVVWWRDDFARAVAAHRYQPRLDAPDDLVSPNAQDFLHEAGAAAIGTALGSVDSAARGWRGDL